MPSQRKTNNRDPLPKMFTFQQGKQTFKHTRGNCWGGGVHNDQNMYKARWDPQEGVTNYFQSGQRELPEGVICKLILTDESEDQHFEMTKKTSYTTVKSVHGEYFLGMKTGRVIQFHWTSICPELTSALSTVLSFCICYGKEKKKSLPCLQWLIILTWEKSLHIWNKNRFI